MAPLHFGQQHDTDGATTAPEGYRRCFLLFLDILGFKDLVTASTSDANTLKTLVDLASVAGSISGNVKETSAGALPIQVRAFSDTFVAFTPAAANRPEALAQLLFLGRFVHDQVLTLGACVRGAVTIGPMYWRKAWDLTPGTKRKSTPPITIGPALVEAHHLESKEAKAPRILVSDRIREDSALSCWTADPFGSGDSIAEHFREDKPYEGDSPTDGPRYFVDLLSPLVTRSSDERLERHKWTLSIRYSPYAESNHSKIIEQCKSLIGLQLSRCLEDGVRMKYEWLRRQVDRIEAAPHAENRTSL